jgi:hypothetical protein
MVEIEFKGKKVKIKEIDMKTVFEEILFKKMGIFRKKMIERTQLEIIEASRDFILKNSKPKIDIFELEGKEALELIAKILPKKMQEEEEATTSEEKINYIG